MIRVNKELLDFMTMLYEAAPNKLIVEQKFERKQIVIEQAAEIRFVHIVKSGIAKCYLSNEDGSEFIQEFFGPGEIFGEIEMFNDDESFSAVEALTDLTAYRISRENFERLLSENPKFNRLILRALAAKIKYKALRHSFNQLNTIEKNLLRLRQQFPELLNTISKPDIANYLGITERSLNRAFKKLKENELSGHDPI